MDFYFQYEQERFNQEMFSYNNYDYEEEEEEEEEEEKEKNNNNKIKKDNDNSFSDNSFHENSEIKTKKINIYFSNEENNEKDSSLEEENENENGKGDFDSFENEYNNLIIKEYKIELNKKYKINKFPRPRTKDLIYKNDINQNYFLSKPSNYESIPSVISSFLNIEDMNSSLKLIRPTQHIFPYNLKGFENTLNLFGFNIEPFSVENYDYLNKDKNNDKNKEYIPLLKIKLNYEKVKIAQCINCKGIYHQLSSHCKKIRSESFYQIYSYKCTICRYKSTILVIEPDSKNDYDNFKKQQLYYMPTVSDINGVCPSIEYLIENNKNKIKRYTMQMIIIDINNIINNEGSIDYIYQSLYQIIKENNDNDNDKEYDNYFKYSLIVYDLQNIYFIHLSNNQHKYLNNKNIEITIMKDYNDPFCPLSNEKLFYNKEDFLILLENFQNWLNIYKNKNRNNNYINNAIKININTIIKSISNIFNNNCNCNCNSNCNLLYYQHLIIFSFSYPNLDLGYLKNNSNLKFYISLFLSMNKLDKNIPFINNTLIHNIKLYLYKIDFKDFSDFKQKCEKIYFDLYSLLSNNSYKDYVYDINYYISYDKSFFYNKLNKNNDTINIYFYPNKKKLNIINILPQYGYPDLIQSFLFQFVIEYYTLLDDYRHIRILSWYNHLSDKTRDVYDSYNQETLFRINLYNYIYDFFEKENKKLNCKNDINIINKVYNDIKNKNSAFFDIEKKIKEKIVNTIIKYRREVYMGKDFYMILIPHSIRNIILYFYSFFKQVISGENLNLFNSLFNDKNISFIKNIYPNILSLKYLPDNKKEEFHLRPSSIWYIHRNQLLLIDNGEYIKIIINDKVNGKTLKHFLINFELNNENEKKELLNDNNDIEFYTDNNYLKTITVNKPFEIEYINENNISNIMNNFNFIEDNLSLGKIM